jgi:hypothetical protein
VAAGFAARVDAAAAGGMAVVAARAPPDCVAQAAVARGRGALKAARRVGALFERACRAEKRAREERALLPCARDMVGAMRECVARDLRLLDAQAEETRAKIARLVRVFDGLVDCGVALVARCARVLECMDAEE